MRVHYDEVAVGTRLPGRAFSVTRADLVRYAGASGDFNAIHWNERAAREVGLPDVVAHGMLVMGLVARAVTDWAGDPGCLAGYRVRFRRPLVVPDGAAATFDVDGVVTEKLADQRVRFDLTVRCGREKVLSAAEAVAVLRA